MDQVDPESIVAVGKVYNAGWLIERFAQTTEVLFNHGGSGVLLTRGLMRAVGGRLRKCAEIFVIPFIGSDCRFAACIARTIWNGSRLVNHNVHRKMPGFNADPPYKMIDRVGPGSQLTFHGVTQGLADRMFSTMLTHVGDNEYFDWSKIAFQPVRFAVGGYQRSYFAIFGCLVFNGADSRIRMDAITGILPSQVSFANFSQQYANDFELFIRCNEAINDTEIAYFGEPPAPHFGVIVEVRCPPLIRLREPETDHVMTDVTYVVGSIY
jgi:hypothetical protein